MLVREILKAESKLNQTREATIYAVAVLSPKAGTSAEDVV
jgi:hypothetical protein